MFQNRMLKGIFGCKRDDIIEGFSFITFIIRHILCDEEVKSMRVTGHVANIGEKRNSCRVLVQNLKEIEH
jgi:hypothetical protein